MKNLKQITLGLFFFCLLFSGFFLFSSKVLAAANLDDVKACKNSMRFEDIAHISCVAGPNKIIFTDSDPTNPDKTYTPPKDAFCKSDSNILVSKKGSGSLDLSDAGSNLNGILNVSSAGNGCKAFDPFPAKAIAHPEKIKVLLKGGGKTPTKLEGVTSGPLSASYDRLNGGSLDPTNGWFLFSTASFTPTSTVCHGSIVAVNKAGTEAIEYTISPSGTSYDKFPQLDQLPKNTGCGVGSADFGLDDSDTPRGFSLSAAVKPDPNLLGTHCVQDPNKDDPAGYTCYCPTDLHGNPGTCTYQASVSGGTGIDDSGSSCGVSGSPWSLTWFVCPLLQAVDVLGTNLMSAFTQQLPFCIAQQGLQCKGQDDQTDFVNGPSQTISAENQTGVRTAWNLLRVVASATLVVVMLIMVISQAAGGGPFDAYTVRKLLPKMAAATILIQVSWPVFAFIVNLFNDIGLGLADLMYAPFGGSANLDFDSLLAHAHVGVGQGIVIGWLGAFLGAAIGVAHLGTMLFGATVIAFSLVVGLATLVFRKVLILLLLILSPIALVCWIMPGQGLQRYWKMWQDNFLKLLAMFPLIIAIIAGGRIFAYVVGAADNGTFINFWLVIVGYFMPLFILPKSYQWGGDLLRSVGNSLTSAQSKIQSAYRQPLKDFAHTLYTGKRADQYDPRKSAVGLDFGKRKNLFGRFGGPRVRPTLEKPWQSRAWRRIQSGHYLPTNRSRNLTLQTGQKWSTERTEEALAFEQKVSRKHQEEGITADEARKWNRQTEKMGHNRGAVAVDENGDVIRDSDGIPVHENDIFKEMGKGVGAGKWSALGLFWQAYAKGDDALMKAIGEHLIKSKSGLEFRNENFLAPYTDKNGNRHVIPMFGHPLLVDRAYKDPELYSILGQLGGDFPPHNTPFGGKGDLEATGYDNVYQRGVRWVMRKRKDGTYEAGENPDFNPDIQQAFGIDIGTTRETAATPIQLKEFKEGKHFIKMAWAAHHAQASYDDAVNNMAMGGSMGGAFIKRLTSGAQRGFAPGEPANQMPARQAAWALIEATRTQQGRDKLAVIQTDPSTRELAEDMFRSIGITHFKDALGEKHEFSIKNLWNANLHAEEVIKRLDKGATIPEAPGREETLLHANRPDGSDARPLSTLAPGGSPVSSRAGAAPAGGSEPFASPEPKQQAPEPVQTSGASQGNSSSSGAGATVGETEGTINLKPSGEGYFRLASDSASQNAGAGGTGRTRTESAELLEATEALKQAAREMKGAARAQRRAAVDQSLLSRRLGNAVPRSPSGSGPIIDPSTGRPFGAPPPTGGQ